MGRPPIGKKAMTDAERQRRRRKALRRAHARQELVSKHAENAAKFAARARQPTEWVKALPVAPPLDDKADELAWQLFEAIQLAPGVTIAAV